VSSVGVISHSHGGGLVANLSAGDLRGLLPAHMGLLAQPVLAFLSSRAAAVGSGWQGSHTAGSSNEWGVKVGHVRDTRGMCGVHFACWFREVGVIMALPVGCGDVEGCAAGVMQRAHDAGGSSVADDVRAPAQAVRPGCKAATAGYCDNN